MAAMFETPAKPMFGLRSLFRTHGGLLPELFNACRKHLAGLAGRGGFSNDWNFQLARHDIRARIDFDRASAFMQY